MISTSVGPFGRWMVTTSPFALPRSARATGDSTLMKPFSLSGSSVPTMR